MTLLSLLDMPPLALEVLFFLTGDDNLRFQCVRRDCRDFVRSNEEDWIFHGHLLNDFPEGRLLVEAFARSRNCVQVPSYKKMYMAFHHRWSVPKASEEDRQGFWQHSDADSLSDYDSSSEEGTENDGYNMNWNPDNDSLSDGDEDHNDPHNQESGYDSPVPAHTDNTDRNTEGNHRKVLCRDGSNTFYKYFPRHGDDNIDNLVFLFRVGDHHKSCGFLSWFTEDYTDCLFFHQADNRCHNSDGHIDLPPLKKETCELFGALMHLEIERATNGNNAGTSHEQASKRLNGNKYGSWGGRLAIMSNQFII